MPKTKAIVLMSGGLDSMLVAKILHKQGIETEGACFTSSFFGCTKAEMATKNLGIKLNVIDISKELLVIVKNPPSGYGKNLNPCIDCHALMIKRAYEKFKPEIVATGEVLGQRPFSQNKEALERVARLAGVEILRPLSAKLLPETEYEKRGLVKRHRLYDIKGRSRYRQEELAREFGLKEYPSPAGGCLLTDPAFSERLLLMLERWPECTIEDIKLLKNGRVFWLKTRRERRDTNKTNYVLAVVGRNKEECERLEGLMRKGDVTMELKAIKGPLTLIRKLETGNRKLGDELEISVPEILKKSELGLDKEMTEEKVLETVALLTGWYATKARGKEVILDFRFKN